MVHLAHIVGPCVLGLLAQLPQIVNGISLTVNPDGGNATSPLLYGFMFEDINHSGDGGLHGQLLRNNGFQGDDANLTAYAAIGNTELAVDEATPLSAGISKSLKVNVPTGTTGQVGFSNAGYWGIQVDGSEYQSYFYIKGAYSGDITIQLVSNITGTVYGTSTVHVDSGDDFTYITTSFPTTRAPDQNVIYTLTFDGSVVAGSSLWFDLIQLFPTTFHERFNGLNPKIANVLDAVKGSFLRFPGGNNLEGKSPETRWKWNETIGLLENRPGRQGDWDYANTDALGLDEYFYWCEDMGLAPLLGVWAGFSLQSGGGTPLIGEALQPYIDDVLNELEYVLGDASTTQGAWRVANIGRTEPWPLTMVEIGNEDMLGGGCPSYPERFTRFHDAIKAVYPDLTVIASTDNVTCLPSPLPEGAMIDLHNYNSPDNFTDLFDYFDNYDRANAFLVGEYAQSGVDWPNMQGAVGEAIYMLGFERNSDLVKMASYAPVLNLIDSTQWKPNMIAFDQSPDGVYLSTSYYVQKLFSLNRGDTAKEITADGDFGPLYWAASSAGSKYYVKLANYGQDVQSVSVTIPGATAATLTVLASDDPLAFNDNTQQPISPVTSDLTGADTFTFDLPAWSVAVLATA